LDFLVRPETRRFLHRLSIDQRAAVAAQVFDERVIVIHRELGMPRRDPLDLDPHLAPFIASDHVIAGPHGLAH
jgi:hypothetical protein